MIHIVFQTADSTTIKEAIKLDSFLEGDVIEIKDDFAVGPINDIYETEGYQPRKEWWREVLKYSPYEDQLEIVDDKLAVHTLLKLLKQDQSLQVWIWMGQNQHDVCGYYWLMSQLKEFQGRIFILYLNNLPFINEKGGIFYPSSIHEIQPKEFLKAKKLARAITLSEFEIDADEWKKLCADNAAVRILEGGKKVTGKDETYYDTDIQNAISSEPQKLHKILNSVFSKMKIRTGDAFLVWRIRTLEAMGIIEILGQWEKGWKEIMVKAVGTVAPIAQTDQSDQ